MPILEGGRLSEGTASYETGRLKLYRADYSFAADGGAVSTIALSGTAGLPAGAIILSAYIEVTAALTSGGAATVALQAENAGDIQAAAAVTGAPWSTTGVKLSSARTRAAAPIKLAAASDVSAVIAVAALTAGAFRVYVEYVEAA